MTRKDYERFAAALKSTAPCPADNEERDLQWHDDIQAVADVLAEDNEWFNRDLFIDTATGGC